MDKRLLNQVFDSVAAIRGSANAIVESDRAISYEHLSRYSNAIAQLLNSSGLEREGVVALFVGQGIDYIASVLGIMKAGGVFMPVNPEFPLARNVAIMNRSKPAFSITLSRHQQSLAEVKQGLDFSTRTIILPEIPARFDSIDFLVDGEKTSAEANPPGLAQDGDDSCYIIHTSGTTGEPKAILGRHKSLSHFIHWEMGEFGLGHDSRIPLFAPPTFDVSLRDTFAPLISGGTVYAPPDDAFRNIGRLVDWIDESKISLIHIVPSLFRLLLAEIETRSSGREGLFTNLKFVLLAGEPLMGRDVNRWRKLFGERIEPVNLYGPSESTLAKCFNRLSGKEFPDEKIVPVGHPISNSAVLILKDNDLCPVGMIGEVFIKTPFLTKGYYRDAELTGQSFVQNPLTETTDIIYKTGDQGRYLADRSVELLGRLDRQVKVNGNRIELGDVEAAALKIGKIDQCYVNTVNRNELTYLVCYYTANEPLLSDELRRHLQKNLPDYAVPSFFVKLDQFPLSLNGKVDKRKLPRPEELLYAGIAYSAPEGDIEERLAEIWSRVLGLPKIGVNNPFFDLGGTSLTAIKLTSEIFASFEVNVMLRDILANPTVRTLAELIRNAKERESIFEVERLEGHDHYPISAGQRRIWFLNQLPGGGTINNMPGAWKINGVFDFWLMERCFNQVIERHESLRTGFKVVDGEPVQIIHQHAPLKFTYTIPPVEVDRDAHIKDVFRSEAKHTFDLENPPLIRCRIIMVGEEESIVMITVHHIVADGVSLDLIATELFRLYRDSIARRETVLPPLPFHYKDYAVWQKGYFASETGKAQENYWREQFREKVEPVDFPLDYPRRSIQTFKGKTFKKSLPDDSYRFLVEFARKEGVSLFALLTSLVKCLIFRYTGQTDIVIGTAVAGRDHPGLGHHVGLFANLVALRDRFSPEVPFIEFLQKVRETVEESLVYQSFPYDHLVESLEIERSMSRTPLFDITIALQEDTHQTSTPEDITVETLEMDWEMTRYDLMFTFKHRSDEILLDIAYNTDLFAAESIEYLHEHLVSLIGSVREEPNKPLQSLSLISSREAEVLKAFSAPKSDPEVPPSVLHAIEKFVKETPDSPAISDGKRVIDYKTLWKLSNGVATELDRLSLPRESVVAIMTGRGIDAIILQIGIMRSGLAFLPLDPSHPIERRLSAISRAECKVVITRGSSDADLASSGLVVLESASVIVENDFAPNQSISSSDLAYVLFTSGSTGTPKGALIEHGGLANSIFGMAKSFGVTSADRGLQFANLVFDASVCEIYTVLTMGGCIYTLTQREIDNTELILDFMNDNRITYVVLPPVLVQSFNRRELPHLRVLVTAGDSPYPDDVEFYRRGATYFNAYGPTECSICISTREVEDEDLKRLRIPIGKPIPNLSARVLGDDLVDQPVGVPGELYGVGTGVGRGYINDPGQTSKAFVTLPDSSDKRAYRTGDRARWLADGSLEYLGRIDRQVKVRGYRIEIGEIEESLASHPGLASAAVIDVKDELGRVQLAAFYVNRDDIDTIEGTAIRRFLGRRLPEYMIPQHFIPMTGLPLNSSGKIDRIQLEKEFAVRPVNLETKDRKGSAEEEMVRAIWQTVLGRPTVKLDDDFFAIGGDSIKAIQIVARLFQEGYSISVADIFEQSSVAGVADVLKLSSNREDGDVVGTVEMTPIQSWFFELHRDNPHHFHQSATIAVNNRLSLPHLSATIDELVRRHDMLRANFELVEGIWKESITEPGHFDFSPVVIDLAASRDAENDLRAHLETLNRSIRLGETPLMKVALFRMPQRDILHVAIHHLIVDGVSWRILMDDFASIYKAHSENREVSSPGKSTSFQKWSAELLALSKTDKILNQLPYWTHIETEGNYLHTGTDRRPERISRRSDFQTVSGSLDFVATDRLLKLLLENGLQTDDFLLAIFIRGLYDAHKTDTLKIQLEGHGREIFKDSNDVSRTVGWFTTVWPAVFKINGGRIEDCLSAVLATKRSIPEDGNGYGILRYLSRRHTPSTAVLRDNPRIRFNFLGQFGEIGAGSEMEFLEGYSNYDHSPDSPVDVDLYFESVLRGGELHWRIEYVRDLYDSVIIEKLTDGLNEGLQLRELATIPGGTFDITGGNADEIDFEGLELG